MRPHFHLLMPDGTTRGAFASWTDAAVTLVEASVVADRPLGVSVSKPCTCERGAAAIAERAMEVA